MSKVYLLDFINKLQDSLLVITNIQAKLIFFSEKIIFFSKIYKIKELNYEKLIIFLFPSQYLTVILSTIDNFNKIYLSS